jgi:hypothetical protein
MRGSVSIRRKWAENRSDFRRKSLMEAEVGIDPKTDTFRAKNAHFCERVK